MIRIRNPFHTVTYGRTKDGDVYGFPDNEQRATCSCGWAGPWHGYFAVTQDTTPEMDFAEHRRTAPEHQLKVENRGVEYVRRVKPASSKSNAQKMKENAT